ITDPVYPVYIDTNVMAGETGAAKSHGGFEGGPYLPRTDSHRLVPQIPPQKLDVRYLCYPHHPTRAVVAHSPLAPWVKYALANDSIILYDVAYQGYIREKGLPRSIYEIDGARRCAMEFHSFSKDGGFTGVRCGYTVCPKDLAASTKAGKKVPLHGLW